MIPEASEPESAPEDGSRTADQGKATEEPKTQVEDQRGDGGPQEEPSENASQAPASLSDTGDLPESYDQTRVVLLPVDPYLVHVYWDLAQSDVQQVQRSLDTDHTRAQPVLRFWEITEGSAGAGQPASFDVDVQLQARNWYIHLWSPGKTYYLDLGFRTDGGEFMPLARSNEVQTPRAGPATEAEEHFMRVEGDYRILENVPAPPPAVPLFAPRTEIRGAVVGLRGIGPAETGNAPGTVRLGPADFRRESGGEQVAEGEFPNPIDSPRFAASKTAEVQKWVQEAQLALHSNGDSEAVDARDGALPRVFPLPGRSPGTTADVVALEERPGEGYLEPSASQISPVPPGTYFDISAMSERALALGVSSDFTSPNWSSRPMGSA